MESQTSKDVIKDLRLRYDISEEESLLIIRSQFRKLKKTIEEYDCENDYYPAIRLINFGSFFVKPSRKINYKKKKNGKTD